MEKKYWIFVDSQDIQNTKDGAPNLFFYVGSVGIAQHAPNGSLEKLRARDDGVSCKQGLCVLEVKRNSNTNGVFCPIPDRARLEPEMCRTTPHEIVMQTALMVRMESPGLYSLH